MLRPEPRKALRSRPEKRVRPHLQRWVSCELSLSKLQDHVPCGTCRPLLMGSPAAAQGHKSNGGPTAMKHQPRHKPRDVQSRVFVVPGQNLVPAVIDPRTLPTQDRPVEVQFKNMGADAPEVEKAISAGLGGE